MWKMPSLNFIPLSIFIYKGVKGEPADLSLIAKENEKSVKKQLQAIWRCVKYPSLTFLGIKSWQALETNSFQIIEKN